MRGTRTNKRPQPDSSAVGERAEWRISSEKPRRRGSCCGGAFGGLPMTIPFKSTFHSHQCVLLALLLAACGGTTGSEQDPQQEPDQTTPRRATTYARSSWECSDSGANSHATLMPKGHRIR